MPLMTTQEAEADGSLYETTLFYTGVVGQPRVTQ